MPHVDLLELPYFDGISMDDLVELVDMMSPRQFGAGEIIVREGDEPPPLYIATSGSVEIVKRSPDGSERRLAELEAPTVFGEIELFCQIRAVSTVRALTPVAVFSLTRERFDRLFETRHPAVTRFTFNMARVACHRLAVADEILARVLGKEDLAELRRIVFARHTARDGWSRTTGIFKRPQQ